MDKGDSVRGDMEARAAALGSTVIEKEGYRASCRAELSLPEMGGVARPACDPPILFSDANEPLVLDRLLEDCGFGVQAKGRGGLKESMGPETSLLGVDM